MTRRDRSVLVVVVMLAAFGAYWMLVLGPKRKDAAALGERVTAAQQRLDTARSDAGASEQARTRYAVSYGNVARLGKAVPADDDVPSLVYQLDSTADSTGVDFRSIKLAGGTGAPPPAANAAQGAAATNDKAGKDGAKAAPDSGAAAPATGTAPGNATPTPGGPTSTPAAAAATQTATAALPPGATVGTAGFATMPFTFEFTGSFFRLSDFFGQVDRYIKAGARKVDVTGRLLMIDGIALQASPTGFPNMTASVAATTYLLPVAEGVTAGATPGGPAAQNVNAGTTTMPAVPATAAVTGAKP